VLLAQKVKYHYRSKSCEQKRCGNVGPRGEEEKDKGRNSRVRGKNHSRRQGKQELRRGVCKDREAHF